MRTPAINAALLRALSAPRLGRYMADSAGILDAAISLYERNARISEAFTQPLQTLEVCLRNHVNARLDAQYGPRWFRISAPPFNQGTLDKLDAAMDKLEYDRVSLSQGAVVAELNFGFWVTLLGRPYDRLLWPHILSPVFLRGGQRMGRKEVHSRMDELRNFRNRVAHYEPIYHLDPSGMHDRIIEAVGWMCPDSAAWLLEHSRVRDVLSNP